MNLAHIRSSVDKYGFPATVHDIAYRAANKLTETLVLKGMTLTMATVDPTFLKEGAEYQWGFLDRETLIRALGQGAEKDMDAGFIERALAKGDRCYGALADGKIASYGWYSTLGTEVTSDLTLEFDPEWAYMYKGYTLPEFRGKRLHGMGMARAMKAYSDEGKKGLISYVESANFASLKSCYRMGYVDIGTIFCVKVGGSYLIHATKGCEAYGFRLEAHPAPH
jgi:hypothetical protein